MTCCTNVHAARDNWVRVRTGLYKDDLAKVVDVDFATQRVSIRLLPRLDLNAMANRVSCIFCLGKDVTGALALSELCYGRRGVWQGMRRLPRLTTPWSTR